MHQSWFCAALKTHREPNLPSNWKCATLDGEPIQDAKFTLGCPRDGYPGRSMPIPGEWMFRVRTKNELTWVHCQDKGHANRTVGIWDYDQQPPIRLRSDALKRQTPMRKHIDILVGAPFWLLSLISGAFPAIFLMRAIARLRRRGFGENRCSRCGYDLTGNISGVCPECGTTIT